jgi:hypothetical protein
MLDVRMRRRSLTLMVDGCEVEMSMSTNCLFFPGTAAVARKQLRLKSLGAPKNPGRRGSGRKAVNFQASFPKIYGKHVFGLLFYYGVFRSKVVAKKQTRRGHDRSICLEVP